MSCWTFYLATVSDKLRLGDRKITTPIRKHYDKKFADCFFVLNYNLKSKATVVHLVCNNLNASDLIITKST